MPWRCPACREHIRHNGIESTPRIGVVYRCHVCRLELTFDDDKRAFDVAPLPSEAVPGKLCTRCHSAYTLCLPFPVNEYNRCQECGWVWTTPKTGDAGHRSQVGEPPKRKRVT